MYHASKHKDKDLEGMESSVPGVVSFRCVGLQEVKGRTGARRPPLHLLGHGPEVVRVPGNGD